MPECRCSCNPHCGCACHSAGTDEAVWTAAALIDEACMGQVCPSIIKSGKDCEHERDPSNWCWLCMARGWLRKHQPASYPGPGADPQENGVPLVDPSEDARELGATPDAGADLSDLPSELAEALRDPGVVIAQDGAVWELIGRASDIPCDTAPGGYVPPGDPPVYRRRAADDVSDADLPPLAVHLHMHFKHAGSTARCVRCRETAAVAIAYFAEMESRSSPSAEHAALKRVRDYITGSPNPDMAGVLTLIQHEVHDSQGDGA